MYPVVPGGGDMVGLVGINVTDEGRAVVACEVRLLGAAVSDDVNDVVSAGCELSAVVVPLAVSDEAVERNC